LDRLPTELADVLTQPMPAEPAGDRRPQPDRSGWATVHRGAEDLADLFLGRAAVRFRASLQRELHILVEPTNDQLGQVMMMAQYQASP